MQTEKHYLGGAKWIQNLWVLWFGNFITGLEFSMTMPFMALFIDTLGHFNNWSLNLLSGAAFAITFLAKAIVSPMWGKLADRKGRKLMCLRASGVMMFTVIFTGMAPNVWWVIFLRGLQGCFSGYVNNANAIVATEAPHDRSGKAMGTLATGNVTGTLLGPLFGGFIAGIFGYRATFYIAGTLMFFVFLSTLFLVHEDFKPIAAAKMRSMKTIIRQLKSPNMLLGIFITTLIIQASATSITPFISLFIRQLLHGQGNLALVSGVISAMPGIATLIAAQPLGNLIDRIGAVKVLTWGLAFATICFIPQIFVTNVWQLGFLRLLVGISDAALLPAVQTLMALNTPADAFDRIFSYNQSFQAMGSVVGPMIGAVIASVIGYRGVFAMTAIFEFCNLLLIWYDQKHPYPNWIKKRIANEN
ncbi:multidrug resistance efflux pump [Lactobacillus selangorensis]|uniref:Multidrug resistance efflux pump n=1 Tax=Lactobacillus selangorensis TaxID=81857 RepID=A0A0R2FJY8_9LACO|nr:MFS transporter [Lactobacillus selangorensis]KRN28947.1 multidrug resistance efflux pump [Lactobacillus selangorensis]KRN32643.1 multidrug resistance efflux pump [Lactobacillus selangorensis]